MMLRLKAKVFSFSGDSYKIVDANDTGKVRALLCNGCPLQGLHKNLGLVFGGLSRKRVLSSILGVKSC